MQTGFVGLGAMGAHMARNLHRAGLLTGVWNRTPEKAKALAAELKVLAFANLTELAGNCEAVVICVSADNDVREVVAGLGTVPDGLSPCFLPNSLVSQVILTSKTARIFSLGFSRAILVPG